MQNVSGGKQGELWSMWKWWVAFWRFRCRRHSLRHRRNLTSVTYLPTYLPTYLFWAPKGLNELLEVRFEFPFILIGKLTMVFFNKPIMARTQILVHRWGPEQGFRGCFVDGLKQSLVSSAAQATVAIVRS